MSRINNRAAINDGMSNTGRLLGKLDIPAGAKLAFIETSEGEHEWWLINADGTGITLDMDGATFEVKWRANTMGALRYDIGEMIEEDA